MLVEAADIHPAFAGISHGYLYLEHRTHRSKEIDLYCDKPRILVPQSYQMVAGLIAFGPVFYENDFAFLQAAALDNQQGKVPNVRLNPLVEPGFRGLINYQDPLTGPVSVVTGGDGTAAFIYTPPDAYGLYLPGASISGNTMTLPVAVPLAQLWNATDGWLTRTYVVTNDNGFFGKVGANAEEGEIPYQESGTPNGSIRDLVARPGPAGNGIKLKNSYTK